MDESARYRWIAAHILPCERELRGWLRQRVAGLEGCEVDDIVQEAYARIWQADFAQIHNGRAYLFATVRHLLVEYLRRSRIVPIELLGEIDSLNLISEEPGPDRRLAARQELEQVCSIVEQLPPRCRRAFELRKFQGLSHREVAQHMGLSEKTVENHLTRALASIAAAWSEHVGARAASRPAGSGRGSRAGTASAVRSRVAQGHPPDARGESDETRNDGED